MTYNEIINLLDCCKHNHSPATYTYSAIQKAIDLINRQKAEIERLKKEVKDKERAYNDEFCLRKEYQSKCREFLKEKQTTKSEAIKEFAERLKKDILPAVVNDRIEYIKAEYDIDKLVKEMTEVNNE